LVWQIIKNASTYVYTGRWTHKFAGTKPKLTTTARKNDVNRGRHVRGAEEDRAYLTSKFDLMGMKSEGFVVTEYVCETVDCWSYFQPTRFDE